MTQFCAFRRSAQSSRVQSSALSRLNFFAASGGNRKPNKEVEGIAIPPLRSVMSNPHFQRWGHEDMSQFRFDPEADAGDTSHQGEVELSPSWLRKTFGRPQVADSEKDLGAYTFSDGDGHVFTVYELAHDVNAFVRFMLRRTFWKIQTPQKLSVGGKSDVSDFINWLRRQHEQSGRTPTTESNATSG